LRKSKISCLGRKLFFLPCNNFIVLQDQMRSGIDADRKVKPASKFPLRSVFALIIQRHKA
jgi:hypothetical protein